MLQLTNFTSDPRQSQVITLPDGSSIYLEIYYNALEYGWFITNLTYKQVVINSFRVCCSPNLLWQYRNQLPFGLAVTCVDQREPTQIMDLVSGAATLYLLLPNDVNDIVEALTGSL